MSETVSAGAGSNPAAAAAPTTGASNPAASQQSAGGAAQGKGGGQASQAGGTPAASGTAEAVEQRILAEQDLDAYIEHTINGRKEKIKVREALNGYGLDKAARQRMSEAARKEQSFNQVMNLFQTDFNKFCEVTGTNKDEFLRSNLAQRKEIAEEVLAREYELQQMDPNQRKALQLEQELTQMKNREMSVKKPLINAIKEIVPADRLPRGLENASEAELKGFLAARQQEFTQGVDAISNEILEAWQQAGLPKEKDFGSWIAQVMLDHDRRAVEHRKRTGEELPPLLPQQAALRVKERFLNSTRSLFSQMDASAIQEALGPEIIQKLRDHDVGLASAQNRPGFDQNRPSGNTGASEPKKQLNQIEWRKAMGIT